MDQRQPKPIPGKLHQPQGSERAATDNYKFKMPDLHTWLTENFEPCRPNLLWAHVTEVGYLLDMLETRYATPRPCKYFHKNLFYLFYGKPAYRDDRDQSVNEAILAPAAILFKSKIEMFAHDIWPFDSGAFWKRRYKDWILEHYEINRFSLKNDPEAARRYIKAFFGGIESYFSLKTIRRDDVDLIPAAAMLNGMLSDRTNSSSDARRFSVEMNTERFIPITQEYVHCLILPAETKFALDKMDFTEKTGISTRPYNCPSVNRPGDYERVLQDAAMLENLGLLP
jgi:hypothetical protein